MRRVPSSEICNRTSPCTVHLTLTLWPLDKRIYLHFPILRVAIANYCHRVDYLVFHVASIEKQSFIWANSVQSRKVETILSLDGHGHAYKREWCNKLVGSYDVWIRLRTQIRDHSNTGNDVVSLLDLSTAWSLCCRANNLLTENLDEDALLTFHSARVLGHLT